MNTSHEPGLVPELLVTDIDRSLTFWHELCGFEIRYARPAERFAYLALGSAHLMLEQIGVGRNWVTGTLETPLGRGINLQISVPDATSLASALTNAGVELFMPPETKWYRVGDNEAGVEQFLVTDPDGYLIRFQSPCDDRPAMPKPYSMHQPRQVRGYVVSLVDEAERTSRPSSCVHQASPKCSCPSRPP